MKYLKIKAICLVMIIAGSLSDVALGQNKDCIKELKEVYRKMNNPELGEKDVYYMDYVVRTGFRDKKLSNSLMEAKVYVSKSSVFFISNDMKVFEDRVNSFTIIPSRKIIYRSDSNLDRNTDKKASYIGGMQDSLLDQCRVRECTRESIGRKEYKKIVVDLTEKGKRMFKLNALTFYIDPLTQTIYKVLMQHTADSQVEFVEMIFNKIDYHYKGKLLTSGLVASLVLNDANQLIPEYQGYKLIDTRIKK